MWSFIARYKYICRALTTHQCLDGRVKKRERAAKNLAKKHKVWVRLATVQRYRTLQFYVVHEKWNNRKKAQKNYPLTLTIQVRSQARDIYFRVLLSSCWRWRRRRREKNRTKKITIRSISCMIMPHGEKKSEERSRESAMREEFPRVSLFSTKKNYIAIIIGRTTHIMRSESAKRENNERAN